MLSKISRRRRTIDTTDILMGDIIGKKFTDRQYEGLDNDDHFQGIQDNPSISAKDQEDFLNLRYLFSNEVEILKEEYREVSVKLRDIENHSKLAKEEIMQLRYEILQAQLEDERITQHLGMLKQETEILKTWHVESQAENEGLRIMKEITTAWKEGLDGRDQLLDFDEILKDILPEDKTVDDILKAPRPNLWSIFNPTIQVEKQKLKNNEQLKSQIKSSFKNKLFSGKAQKINTIS